MNLSIWILVGAINVSSYFSFWKLDYFSEMNRLKNPLSDMISCSSSTQLIVSDWLFSVILEWYIDPEYIHWTSIPFQLEKFQLKVSQYMYYIIWGSHYTKLIVTRLLKLTVSYPEVYLFESMNQYWHSNTEPKFFITRFVKRP